MKVVASPSTDRLERALQASLRPVDPGADFTAALQARLDNTARHASPPADGAPGLPVSRRGRGHTALLGLAASVVAALTVGWQMAELRSEQQAQQIHKQVLLALEITSERLGLAQQRIEQYQSQENRL